MGGLLKKHATPASPLAGAGEASPLFIRGSPLWHRSQKGNGQLGLPRGWVLPPCPALENCQILSYPPGHSAHRLLQVGALEARTLKPGDIATLPPLLPFISCQRLDLQCLGGPFCASLLGRPDRIPCRLVLIAQSAVINIATLPDTFLEDSPHDSHNCHCVSISAPPVVLPHKSHRNGTYIFQ